MTESAVNEEIHILRKPFRGISTPVRTYAEIKEIAKKMVKRIRAGKFPGRWSEAYALTHSQVVNEGGVKRFFVVNRNDEIIGKVFRHDVIVNPVIVGRSEEMVKFYDACMSVPNRKPQKIRRHAWLRVKYQVPLFGRWLRTVQEKVDGLKAHVFEHEIEHFEGKY